MFECTGFAVVNGAQTVGACNKAFKIKPESGRSAFVMAKIIATGSQDNELAIAVTKAANTQNRIERKDFVSLDPYQKELKDELEILGIKYVYKTGENRTEDAYDLSFITQALAANTKDIGLIALAKREIGKIWDDINKPPYTVLFNKSNNAYYIKNIINIFSKIQEIIQTTSGDDRRKIQYSIHGNIFIAARCMEKIDQEKITTSDYDLEQNLNLLIDIVPREFNDIYDKAEKEYPGAYLAYLFRNVTKLNQLIV